MYHAAILDMRPKWPHGTRVHTCAVSHPVLRYYIKTLSIPFGCRNMHCEPRCSPHGAVVNRPSRPPTCAKSPTCHATPSHASGDAFTSTCASTSASCRRPCIDKPRPHGWEVAHDKSTMSWLGRCSVRRVNSVPREECNEQREPSATAMGSQSQGCVSACN